MSSTNITAMIPINKPWIGEEERHEVMHVLEENALNFSCQRWGKESERF